MLLSLQSSFIPFHFYDVAVHLIFNFIFCSILWSFLLNFVEIIFFYFSNSFFCCIILLNLLFDRESTRIFWFLQFSNVFFKKLLVWSYINLLNKKHSFPGKLSLKAPAAAVEKKVEILLPSFLIIVLSWYVIMKKIICHQ